MKEGLLKCSEALKLLEQDALSLIREKNNYVGKTGEKSITNN